MTDVQESLPRTKKIVFLFMNLSVIYEGSGLIMSSAMHTVSDI